MRGCLLLILAAALGQNVWSLKDYAVEQAIRSGNVASLRHWGDIPHDIWELVEQRPKNMETLELIRQLLEAGASPGLVPVEEGYTPAGDTKLMPQEFYPLLRSGNIWDMVMAYPASPQRIQVIESLCRHGDPSARFLADLQDQGDQEGFKAAALAIFSKAQTFGSKIAVFSRAGRYDMITLLEAVTNPDGAGPSPDYLQGVNLAVLLDDTQLFNRYLQEGVRANAFKQSQLGFTLLVAMDEGRDEAVRALVVAGAADTGQGSSWLSPLAHAVLLNYENYFPLLLRVCKNPEQPDSSSFTALHLAAWAGNYPMVEALLARGLAVDGVEDIPSPLAYAVQGGGPETLKLLLEALGDHVSTVLQQGNSVDSGSPFERAVKGINASLVCSALENYSMPKVPTLAFLGQNWQERGAEANWAELQYRKTRTVQLLLAAGADPMRPLEKNKSGKFGGSTTVLHAFFLSRYHGNILNTGRNSSYRVYYTKTKQNTRSCEAAFESLPKAGVVDREYARMLNMIAPLATLPGTEEHIENLCTDALNKQLCITTLLPYVPEGR